MKIVVSKILAIFFYFCAAAILVLYLTVEFKPELKIANYRVIFAVMSCFLSFVASRFLAYNGSENFRISVMRNNTFFMLFVYLFLLINLTLVDPIYRRNPVDIFDWSYRSYIDQSLNLIPFKTIKIFFNGWRNGLVSTHDAYINLLGNVFAFSPFAFFLPLISKKKTNIFKFTATIFLIVTAIEISQFILRTGYCDIDDLILNSIGAVLLYLILHTDFFRRRITGWMLLEY